MSHLNLVNSFLDTLSSNFLSPQIVLPTRIFSSSTLIDNTFCNITHTAKSISRNLTPTVSDHLPQFLILPILILAMHCHQNTISTYMTRKNLMTKNSSLNLIARIGIIFQFLIRKILMKQLTISCRIFTTYWKNMHL